MFTRRTSGFVSRTSTGASRPRRSSSAGGARLSEDGRYSSAVAAELADDVLARFLRYVRIDTQSDAQSSTVPTTAKQRDLGELLARELREIGFEDAQIDEHGIV